MKLSIFGMILIASISLADADGFDLLDPNTWDELPELPDPTKMDWSQIDPSRIDWGAIDLSKVPWDEIKFDQSTIKQLGDKIGIDLGGVDLEKAGDVIKEVERLKDVDLGDEFDRFSKSVEKEITAEKLQERAAEYFSDIAIKQLKEWSNSGTGLEVRDFLARNNIYYWQVVEGLRVLKNNKILTKQDDCEKISRYIAEGAAAIVESEGGGPLVKEATKTFYSDMGRNSCNDVMDAPAGAMQGDIARGGFKIESITYTFGAIGENANDPKERVLLDNKGNVVLIRNEEEYKAGQLKADPSGNYAGYIEAKWKSGHPKLYVDRNRSALWMIGNGGRMGKAYELAGSIAVGESQPYNDGYTGQGAGRSANKTGVPPAGPDDGDFSKMPPPPPPVGR